ncbi:microtubule binding protein, putative [Brugia malayi]|uniref:BMA-EBP-2 n=1 Tax=Brugia malayi TaxID=6279 RepID=A0A0K0JY12_BRUMA|nr:microtubule binding protein, putative [Brugia malayi]CRZ23218.1 BMA-EBP-2 [Brugia malayi]VIO89871.1 microtubule binding protein, putative [Brugia malayi]
MVVNVYATSATLEQCSRNELLAFVNNFLRANFTRIEELSSGAAYCQLTELLFPGKISLKKVKWNSRNEVDWINNWRMLQTVWKELGVKKGVPVERLLRCKFQDNFEFLQWFKKFFDANYDGRQYDALRARNNEPLPASWTASSRPVPSKAHKIARNNSFATSTRREPCSSGRNIAAEIPNTITLQREYELMIQELKENVRILRNQRHFYHDKVRKIKLLCQNAQGSSVIPREEIMAILYETQENFVAPDQECNQEDSYYIGEQNGAKRNEQINSF